MPSRILIKLLWPGSPLGWDFSLKWRPCDAEPGWHRTSARGILHLLPTFCFSLMFLIPGLWILATAFSGAERGFAIVLLSLGGLWLGINAIRATGSLEILFNGDLGSLVVKRKLVGTSVVVSTATLDEAMVAHTRVRFTGLVSGKLVGATALLLPEHDVVFLASGGSAEDQAFYFNHSPLAGYIEPTSIAGPFTVSKYVVL